MEQEKKCCNKCDEVSGGTRHWCKSPQTCPCHQVREQENWEERHAGWEAGFEAGRATERAAIAEKVEKMKYLEAAFNPHSLELKQMHNKALDKVLSLLQDNPQSK